MSQTEKMTLTLEQTSEGIMNASFDGDANDDLRVLSTAILIFLNDARSLQHYLDAAKIYLENKGENDE